MTTAPTVLGRLGGGGRIRNTCSGEKADNHINLFTKCYKIFYSPMILYFKDCLIWLYSWGINSNSTWRDTNCSKGSNTNSNREKGQVKEKSRSLRRRRKKWPQQQWSHVEKPFETQNPLGKGENSGVTGIWKVQYQQLCCFFPCPIRVEEPGMFLRRRPICVNIVIHILTSQRIENSWVCLWYYLPLPWQVQL